MTSRDSLKSQIAQLVHQYHQLHQQQSVAGPFELIRSTFEPDEMMAAIEVLLDGQVTMGAQVRALEQAWSQWNGSTGSLMVNSGSSANLLGLVGLCSRHSATPIMPGDEVIVPAVCWSTSVFPVVQMGAIPVFVDVDPVTLNLNLTQLEAALKPETRGIVAVHVLGNPCPMREIMDFARQHRLVVLEDCCEAHGATIDGTRVGNFGDLATFSFFLSHHMTTIEGGMICFREPERWQDFLISQRAHGWIRGRSDQAEWMAKHPDLTGGWLFVETGFNLRPTEMHAAIGLQQIARLDDFVQRRKLIARQWSQAIQSQFGEWLAVQQALPGHSPSPFGLGLWVKPNAPFKRSVLQEFLQAHEIYTRPLITGNFLRQPVIQHIPHRTLQPDHPVADLIHDQGFMIGIHHDLTASAVDYFIAILSDFMRAYA